MIKSCMGVRLGATFVSFFQSNLFLRVSRDIRNSSQTIKERYQRKTYTILLKAGIRNDLECQQPFHPFSHLHNHGNWISFPFSAGSDTGGCPHRRNSHCNVSATFSKPLKHYYIYPSSLYGIACVQFYTYSANNSKDGKLLKTVVGIVTLMVAWFHDTYYRYSSFGMKDWAYIFFSTYGWTVSGY